jgi:hypothetical protein
MNPVEIVFTGIVYLLGPSKTDASLQAIIPAFAEPSAPFGQVIPGHYAYVRVAKSYVDEAKSVMPLRAPDFVYRELRGPAEDKDNPEYWVFGLTGDNLTLEGADDTPPLKVCHQEADCEMVYDRVPHRKFVCPDCTGLDPVFLEPKASRIVAGRMTIDRGKLSAANSKDDQTEWSFEPMRMKTTPPGKPDPKTLMGGYPHGQIADLAIVAVTPTAGNVVLRITPFSGNRTAKLTLKEGARIEIGNLMPDDVLPHMIHHGHEAVDPHFGLYYTMLVRPFFTDADKGSITDPPVPHKGDYPPPHPGGPQMNCVPFADEPDYP